jgi:SAM-dependent methyltransferase
MMLDGIGGIRNGDRVLEPSAGRGDIADAIAKRGGHLVAIEPHRMLIPILEAKGFDVFGGRFEDYAPAAHFDAVVMNPPFAKGLDMAHVRRAVQFLKPGGRLASLLSANLNVDHDINDEREFAGWLFASSLVQRFTLERLPGELFTSPDVFRPSRVRMKLLTLRRAED